MSFFLVLLLAATASALTFMPSNNGVVMWDTWLFKYKSTYYLNYLKRPYNVRTATPWDGVNGAISSDGVHFSDAGAMITKDPAAVWLGSGSIVPKRKTSADEDDEFVMNFSQQFDCQPASNETTCQSIFFATSKDLFSWSLVAPGGFPQQAVFKYNLKYYKVGGRWDCISVLPAKEGYFGYWTATPLKHPNFTTKDGHGAGFGFSKDGLTWDALPTPGPDIEGEVGGVAIFNEKVYLLFDEGHLYSALNPAGPFKAEPSNFVFLAGGSAVFPRFWGQVYTGSASEVLLTHQQVPGHEPQFLVYLGLVKQVKLQKDNVLRAVWWPNNDVLKGQPLVLPVVPGLPTCPPFNGRQPCPDLTAGLWVEGTASLVGYSGVWIRAINLSDVNPNPSDDTFGFAFRWSFENNTFQIGTANAISADLSNFTLIQSIDRAITWEQGNQVPWKLLFRNMQTNITAVEFYMDDVLVLPFALPEPYLADGFLTPVGESNITQVNQLTLSGGF